MRKRPCHKCASDQPHPLSHWHVKCPYCRRWRIFRGPSCGDCYRLAHSLIADLEERGLI